jgi:hypothetical protein
MSELVIAPFPNTPVSLGLLCDFVSGFPPFNTFAFGEMTLVLRYQLETGCHLVAGLDDRIVGYLGWIRTTRAIADNWSAGNGPLTAVPDNADAVAATILVTEKPKFALPLLRQAKQRNGAFSVYWKRQFADGRANVKRSVLKKA